MISSNTQRALHIGIIGLLLWGSAVPGSAAAADGGGAAAAVAPEAAEPAVAGRVSAGAKPLAEVTVFAYEAASAAVSKVKTDGYGRFAFGALPAGMYQIVAYKAGFVPVAESLLRQRPNLQQFVEIRMKDEKLDEVREAEDYWSVRGRIPGDVLREIQSLELDDRSLIAAGSFTEGQFFGEMLAHGGVEQLGAAGEVQRAAAEVGVHGDVGAMKLSVNGKYEQVSPLGDPTKSARGVRDGEVRAVAVELQGPEQQSKLTVATSLNQVTDVRQGEALPVDFEHYQVDWESQVGERGQSGVTAQFTEQDNYYQAGGIEAADIPQASKTWKVEGFYTAEVTENTSLRAVVSYRQLDGEGGALPPVANGELARTGNAAGATANASATASANKFLGELPADDPAGLSLSEETVGLSGLAETQIQPRVLVEYGFFSTVRGGSWSLMPHGGMVVQLGGDWKAHTTFSQRVEDGREDGVYRGFRSAFYSDRTSCQRAGEACYEVRFAHGDAKDSSLSIGAVHRRYAETLRLYFSDDFFNRLESLFVVEGDELPEVQFKMVRRISPRVLAKLESNFAEGGGGIFYATDDQPYENRVRYLVTSVDTQFQQTSTGVFVAFHHLEQSLAPLDPARQTKPEIEMQRLQLMLTQDLNVLADVAANWAVRFNLELSRGSTPYTLTTDDELRKKLTGGISVTF